MATDSEYPLTLVDPEGDLILEVGHRPPRFPGRKSVQRDGQDPHANAAEDQESDEDEESCEKSEELKPRERD